MAKWYVSTEPLKEKYNAMNHIQVYFGFTLLLKRKQERANELNNVVNRALQKKIRKIW